MLFTALVFWETDVFNQMFIAFDRVTLSISSKNLRQMTTLCRAGQRAAMVPLAHVMVAVQVPFGRVGGLLSMAVDRVDCLSRTCLDVFFQLLKVLLSAFAFFKICCT